MGGFILIFSCSKQNWNKTAGEINSKLFIILFGTLEVLSKIKTKSKIQISTVKVWNGLRRGSEKLYYFSLSVYVELFSGKKFLFRQVQKAKKVKK